MLSTHGAAGSAVATETTVPSTVMNQRLRRANASAPLASPAPTRCDSCARAVTEIALPTIIGTKLTTVAMCAAAAAGAPRRPTSARSTRLTSAWQAMPIACGRPRRSTVRPTGAVAIGSPSGGGLAWGGGIARACYRTTPTPPHACRDDRAITIGRQPMPERVSILLPARDAESTLPACLRSIARQSLRDFRCIVVDDGSRDDTARLARAHAARDPRFLVVAGEGRGLVAALTTG